MKICKQCKKQCENEAKFCQECGYRFTEDDKIIKVCKNCNTHNSESSKFCQECGFHLDNVIVNATTKDIQREAENKPNSASEPFIKKSNINSLPNEENGSQTNTEHITQPTTDAVEEDKTETLVEPDPDLRELEASNPSQSGEKTEDLSVQTENNVSETAVVPEITKEDESPVAEPVTELPVEEKQTSNVTKLLDFDFANAKSEENTNQEVESNFSSESESENGSQTDSDSSSTEKETNNGPSVAEIIAKDPYYDDVPLNDKEEIEKPSFDKDKIKKIVALIAGALVFIAAITVVLVITS